MIEPDKKPCIMVIMVNAETIPANNISDFITSQPCFSRLIIRMGNIKSPQLKNKKLAALKLPYSNAGVYNIEKSSIVVNNDNGKKLL